MKMVSAAKLRKAQDAIIQIRPYSDKLQGILKNVSKNAEPGMNKKYAQRPYTTKVLLIAITYKSRTLRWVQYQCCKKKPLS